MIKIEKIFCLVIVALLFSAGFVHAQVNPSPIGRPGSDGRAGNDYLELGARSLDLNVNVKMPEMERIIQDLAIKMQESRQQNNKQPESDDLEEIVDLVKELDVDCSCEKRRESDLRELKLNAQELSTQISKGGARTLSAAELNKVFQKIIFVSNVCDCEVARLETIKELQKVITLLSE